MSIYTYYSTIYILYIFVLRYNYYLENWKYIYILILSRLHEITSSITFELYFSTGKIKNIYIYIITWLFKILKIIFIRKGTIIISKIGNIYIFVYIYYFNCTRLHLQLHWKNYISPLEKIEDAYIYYNLIVKNRNYFHTEMQLLSQKLEIYIYIFVYISIARDYIFNYIGKITFLHWRKSKMHIYIYIYIYILQFDC